jgi:hypothetical protein
MSRKKDATREIREVDRLARCHGPPVTLAVAGENKSILSRPTQTRDVNGPSLRRVLDRKCVTVQSVWPVRAADRRILSGDDVFFATLTTHLASFSTFSLHGALRSCAR